LLFDELVQPVKVDVGQDRAGHSTLRRAAEGRVPAPVLQVSGLEHVADKPQEPAIVDPLRQDRHHDLMVEAAKTVGDVPLDEPVRPLPDLHHLAQRGVAAPARAKPVGAVGELGLVVGLQQQAAHLGDQLVRPGRQAQRARLPVGLGVR
jgi:hypothetical protein